MLSKKGIDKSSMKKLFKLTQDGIDELKAELDALIGQRHAVAERIKAAREEQDRLETRISELENVIKNVKVIRKPKASDSVTLGSTVKLKSAGGKEKEFQVVGTWEADPLAGKISDESPIGTVLMGKKVGDKVVIHNSPDTAYKITFIS